MGMAREMDDTITNLGDRLTVALRDLDDAKRKLANAERWIVYLAACQAATVETIEQRKTTTRSDINGHRAVLNACIKAVNSKPFDRLVFTRQSFEWYVKHVHEVAARYPYLPAERGEVE